MGARRILIVDDDCDFLESLELTLINRGHEVLSVTDGRDAVSRYAEFRPDIVFLDIKMPGLDGYETFLRIRAADSDARVVFTSSYVINDAKYLDARARSLAGMVNKPIGPDVLDRMIRRHAK